MNIYEQLIAFILNHQLIMIWTEHAALLDCLKGGSYPKRLFFFSMPSRWYLPPVLTSAVRPRLFFEGFVLRYDESHTVPCSQTTGLGLYNRYGPNPSGCVFHPTQMVPWIFLLDFHSCMFQVVPSTLSHLPDRNFSNESWSWITSMAAPSAPEA